MSAIEDTVYKGIDYALDPTRRKIIFNGTPFNKMDILYKAVESGAWDVNLWPVCEHFPCTREEFAGSWDDRFTYEYVVQQYNDSVRTGQVAAFNQELMLRITSEEERLVQDSEIRWYKRSSLLKNRGAFNFYITTDFATSDKETADYSVISVWAINSNGDWFWVDGVCKRMKMNESIDHLFRIMGEFVSEISLATQSGIKGKDDCLDTISMLAEMNPWRPSEDSASSTKIQGDVYDDEPESTESVIDSYVI